jgi:hypothetical protein
MYCLRGRVIGLVSTGVVMLIVGLAIGLAVGSAGVGSVHATGMRGFVDIFNGTDVSSCVSDAYGCMPSQLSNVCQVEGNSDAITCDFQAAPHSGDTIHEEGIQCFNATEAAIPTANSSEIDDTPSGNVHIRCVFPEGGPSGIGLLGAAPAA